MVGMAIAQAGSTLVLNGSFEDSVSSTTNLPLIIAASVFMLLILLLTIYIKHWSKKIIKNTTYVMILLLAVSTLLLGQEWSKEGSVSVISHQACLFICLASSCWCIIYWLRQMAHISRLAAFIFAFGTIILFELLMFVFTQLPIQLRFNLYAVLAAAQAFLIILIKNRDALSDVLPYASDGFFGFVKNNISSRAFLTTIAIGLFFVVIPLGMARGYYENLGFQFTLQTSIAYLIAAIALSSVWIILAYKEKESAYSTLFWIVTQITIALAITSYAIFSEFVAFGAILTMLATVFIWGFIWFTTVAFINYGWRDPFYYAVAGWLVMITPQTFGHLSVNLIFMQSDNQAFILELMSLLLLVSSQIFFVRLFKTTTPKDETPAYKKEKVPIQTLMGLNATADLPAEHMRSRIEEKAKAIGEIYFLTEREVSVLSLFALGYTQKKVAQELFLSTETVHTYIKRVYKKTNFHSRNDILDFMQENL
jgi:DNA-binding CsgD family transcriptional regulator